MSDFTIDVNVGSSGDAPLISTQSAFYDGPTDPTFFTVVGDFKAFIADTSGDVDADPDTSPITATVTFTPMIDTGDLILATHVDPRPTAYVPASITGTIGTDGRLKLASAPFGDYPFTPIRLLADTPLLELSTPLFYTVTFTNVIIDGKSSSIRPFTFQAPNADLELNLITIYRQPGQAASGIVKIAPTGVRFEDDQMIFTYGGVDIPDPLPLNSITPTVAVGSTTTLEPGSNATVENSGDAADAILDFGIPHGEAATVSVGTVTNLAPNSAATVVNSGTSGDAIFDFGIPEGEAATITVGTVDVVDPGDPATVTNVGDNHDAIFDFEIPKGDAATIAVGTVTSVLPGNPATVENSGNSNAAVFDFEIPQGEAASIQVGTVSNLAPNSSATVTNSGTTGDAVFDFGIPEGEAATVAVGTVSAVAPGQPATVENSGDNHNAVFDFEIPQGEAATIQIGTVTTVTENDPATVTNIGDTNAVVLDFELPQGITGDTGDKGDAATVTIGTITTVSPTSSASVTNVGTVYDAVLNFNIPKGDTGSADQTEWNSIPNKPAVVAEGATEADARASIDAEYTGNKGVGLGYASLDAGGKVPYSQLPSSIMAYQGVWNATTNTPTLADGTGDQGDTYRVTGVGPMSFSGSFGTYVGVYDNGGDYYPGQTVLFEGNYYTRIGEPNPGYPPGSSYWSSPITNVISFNSGDYVIYNGTTWEKSDGTDGITSVAGKTGTVTLVKADVGLSDVDNTSDAAKPISTATQTALDGKEPVITAGVTSQYWRGDKTWQTLDKSTVGLSNVDDTSDLNKPVSTATQSALDTKEPTLAAGTNTEYYRGDKSWQPLNKAAVGLANVDNVSDANKPISDATQTALNSKANSSHTHAQADITGLTAALDGKEPTITAGTTSQFWRGDKSFQTLDKNAVGLSNVDNTADIDKNVLSASKLTTARTINGVSFDGTQNITIAGGIQRSVASSSVALTLPAEASTDYVYFLGGTPGVAAGPGDPHWSSVTSLLNFNSAVTTDSATSPTTWTNNGTLTLSTSVKRFGASSLFSSTTGQYLSTTTSTRFDVGAATPFTVECWVNPTDTTGSKSFFSLRTTNAVGPFIIGQSGTSFVIFVGNAALSAWELNGFTGSVAYFTAGAWTHVALVGTGTELWLYINGVPVFGHPQPSWTSANRGLLIGGDPWWAWHTGYLDGFRFTKGVARYSNAFSIPTSEFLANTPTAAVDPTYANPTLPTAVGNTNVYTLRNTFGLPLTVGTTNSQTIEGQVSFAIDPGETFSLISDGSNWRIV